MGPAGRWSGGSRGAAGEPPLGRRGAELTTRAAQPGKPVEVIRDSSPAVARGQCACGKVRIEIDVPARWAWHDHSAASRRAHGAAYATYVGSWRSRFRITKGASGITRY